MRINWIYYTLCPLSIVLILKWYIDIGFRINFFEVFILFFIAFCFIFFRTTLHWNTKVRLFLIYIWGFFLIASLSIVCIVLYNSVKTAFAFYLKGILQLFIYSVFWSFFAIVLTSIDEKKFQKIINFYLIGVFLSIAYSFLQIVLKIRYKIDIDILISNLVPFINKVSVSRYEYGNFFRINGLAADPNIHACYCLSALPFMIVKYFNKGGKKYILGIGLILLSIILSMSISALIGVFTVLLLVSFYYFPRLNRVLIIAIPLLIVALVFYFMYKEEIDQFVAVKFALNGTSRSHLLIAIKSVKIFFHYPFGVGFNNFSIAYMMMYGKTGMNPHNSWLTYLVELGAIGFFFKTLLFFMFFRIGMMLKSESGRIFAITIAGLSFAALGYESLGQFYSQYWIALLFVYCIRENIAQKI